MQKKDPLEPDPNADPRFSLVMNSGRYEPFHDLAPPAERPIPLGNPLGDESQWTKERLAKIPQFKDHFVALVSQGFFPSQICTTIPMGIRTYKAWLEADETFAQAIADANERFLDNCDYEMVKRATIGELEPVIFQGQLSTFIDKDGQRQPLLMRKKDNGLLQFIMKTRRREVYGDKVTVEKTAETPEEMKEAEDYLISELKKLVGQS